MKSTSLRVMPASVTAPVTTSSSIWVSVLAVWRSIGEMSQPMMAMSSALRSAIS